MSKFTDKLPFEVRPKSEFTPRRWTWIAICVTGALYFGWRTYVTGCNLFGC